MTKKKTLPESICKIQPTSYKVGHDQLEAQHIKDKEPSFIIMSLEI